MSSKGQITVPLEVRKRLGLREGDHVEFVMEGKATVIRPARATPNPFAKYAGVLGTFPVGQDEINAWVKSLREDEEGRD